MIESLLAVQYMSVSQTSRVWLNVDQAVLKAVLESCQHKASAGNSEEHHLCDRRHQTKGAPEPAWTLYPLLRPLPYAAACPEPIEALCMQIVPRVYDQDYHFGQPG